MPPAWRGRSQHFCPTPWPQSRAFTHCAGELKPRGNDCSAYDQTLSGRRRCSLRTHFMRRCPKSTGSQYIIGQPPIRQLILRRSHSAAASSDTLPCPKERGSQTWRIPRSAHSRTTCNEQIERGADKADHHHAQIKTGRSVVMGLANTFHPRPTPRRLPMIRTVLACGPLSPASSTKLTSVPTANFSKPSCSTLFLWK